ISGLYQRRHEAELKLSATEQNLARVDDVVEQLAQQLAQLARQARQAARYREIGEELRRAEGMLLYRRWREADEARAAAEAGLTECTRLAAQGEAAARVSAKARGEAEGVLPPLRGEEAVAAALLQRLQVSRDALKAEEARAVQTIETLTGRIGQLARDMEREAGLNRDAGETIGRLEWEQAQLAKAAEGHEDELAEALEAAQAAARVLSAREAALSELTEDVARLSARHQSAHRLFADSRATVEKSEAEAARARTAAAEAEAALAQAAADRAAAERTQAGATTEAAAAGAALVTADEARTEVQARETEARAVLSEAE